MDAATLVERAAESLLIAHHALGRMAGATSMEEFAEAAHTMLAAARSASRSLALLADIEGDERHRAFASWFDDNIPPLLRHPLEQNAIGAVHVSRTAPTQQRAEDFFFEGAAKRPAIGLSAEYVEQVSTMLAMTKRALKHFGLTS